MTANHSARIMQGPKIVSCRLTNNDSRVPTLPLRFMVFLTILLSSHS